MGNELVLNATLNDLIFKGRNKTYGAYLLRMTYEQNMTKGIIIGVGIFLVLITSPLFNNNKNSNNATVIPVENYDTLVYDNRRPEFERIIRESLPASGAKNISTEKPLPNKVISDDDKTTETIEDTKPLENIIPNEVGGSSGENIINSGDASGDGEERVSTGNKNDSEGTLKPSEEDARPFADEMPLFPGGMEELYKYLQRKLHYPSIAYDNGIEGTVLVQFMVDSNGSIKRAKIVSRESGMGFDEEALKVINAMPKWVPGKSKGKSVPVIFTLPIKFRIEKK
ncbi:MAG: energy transducer TonB [Saprospiraceae bacterium]|nr:energy transducer TonB [Saprospiraceae bacterium]